MKKILLSFLFGLFFVQGAISQWNFQFKATIPSGIHTTTVHTYPFSYFEGMGILDLSASICEGGQFNLQTLSNGFYNNCMSGAETIDATTLWDVRFGNILSSSPPSFSMFGSWALQNSTWASSGINVTVPINQGTVVSGQPGFVYYKLMMAPKMGCNLYGLVDGTAGCKSMLYITIKVKKSAVPLNDITICKDQIVTNALLNIPAGVTATGWLPSDPRVTSPSVTTTYTYSLSNGTCPINDNIVITVNPTNPIITVESSLCSGVPLQVFGESNDVYATTYTWSILNNLDAVIGGPYVTTEGSFIFPISLPCNRTYKIKLDVMNSCNMICTVFKTITIGCMPTLSAVSNQTICSSSNAIFNVTTNKWPIVVKNTANGATIGTFTANPIVLTPSITTSYSFTSTSSSGCSVTKNAAVTVIQTQNQTITGPSTVASSEVNGLTFIGAMTSGTCYQHAWFIQECTSNGTPISSVPEYASNWSYSNPGTFTFNSSTTGYNPMPSVLPCGKYYRIKLVTWNAATNGCYKEVTKVVYNSCSTRPEACFNFASTIYQTANEPSYYGPMPVSTLCAPAKINGSCSINEKGYEICVQEWDLMAWTIKAGTSSLYCGWINSTSKVPLTDINLSTLIGTNSFATNKVYAVWLAVSGSTGTEYSRTQTQFFRVQSCSATPSAIASNDNSNENINSVLGAKLTSSEVSISPNPTNGKFNIDLMDVSAEKIVVYNMLGKVVSETVVTENARSLDIDLSELPASVYMVHVHAGNEVILKKVIKE